MKHLYLAAAAAIVIAVPAQAQVVGVASAVKNDVRVRKPNVAVARPVALKQRMAIADTVQTGAKAQLQVVLLDRSIFTVGANARVTIDRYVYDPQRNSRSMGATVGRGSFRFLSGRRTTGSTTINTPTAAIGVRGTIVEGVVGEDAVLIANGERGIGRGVRADPDTASLIILRGPGRATTANVLPGVIDVTAGGRTVMVDRPMQAVYVPYPGATPIGPFTISENGLRQVQALLQPSVAQRLGLQGPVDPNRTYTETPEFDEGSGAGPTRFPRRPGRPNYGNEPGALPDDDGPPSTRVPLPLGPQGTFQPQPRPQQQQQPAGPNGKAPAAPVAPDPQAGKPALQAAPNGKNPAPAPPVAADPPPGKPQPLPNQSLKSAPPNPAPTPTPSPGQKVPGKPGDNPSPNDPPPKPKG